MNVGVRNLVCKRQRPEPRRTQQRIPLRVQLFRVHGLVDPSRLVGDVLHQPLIRIRSERHRIHDDIAAVEHVFDSNAAACLVPEACFVLLAIGQEHDVSQR